MPAIGRLGDNASVDSDAHGCPTCPHAAVGPAVSGSADVNVNGMPALRVQDGGMHAACCGSGQWTAAQGSSTVFINGKAAFRAGDPTTHCGGSGKLMAGSPNVNVGDSSSAGAAAGAAASQSSAQSDGAQTAASQAAASTAAASATPGAAEPAQPAPAAEAAPSTTAPATTAPADTAPAAKTAAAAKKEEDPLDRFVEIHLVDDDGRPVAGERYLVELSDGTRRSGFLNAEGRAVLWGIAPGSCKVTFPELDGDLWDSL